MAPSKIHAAPSTHDALLAAAAEEFAQRGLHGARVHAIVRRAGINERMIYHHFGSKDGLYRAVLHAQWRAVVGAWDPVLARAATLEPRDGLELAFSRFAHSVYEHPLFMRLAMHEALNGWELAPHTTIGQVPAQVHTLFRRGVRTGVFRADITFDVFYLTLLGAIISRVTFGERFADLQADARAFGDQAIRLVLDGLTPAGGPAPTPRRRSRKRASRKKPSWEK